MIFTLFNLLECNLRLKNYIQADYLLGSIQQMVRGDVELTLKANYQIKKAKLEYFRGNIEKANIHCQEGVNMLVIEDIESIELAEGF